ncbi:MAG: VWA domain-containing protein [Planctomycetota bacterium]
MSALAWLFGLGIFAVAFPFLFHLIRRTPKGQQQFSSLMFLRPSPPRLTKRSRLENLLLLALRMGAIALIAAAFMRPFFRQNVDLGMSEGAGRKVAVLLDTSASMRRGDLWNQAVDRVEKITRAAEAKDDVAVYTFDNNVKCHIPFGMKSSSSSKVNYRLNELEPSWHRADLGKALAQLADELDQSNDEETSSARLQIVVVSDMQVGSSTSVLQSYGWPENVLVDVDRIEPSKPTSNATLELLVADEAEPGAVRDLVLVRNGKSSKTDQFTVSWTAANDESDSPSIVDPPIEVPFYVPPGGSKILQVARGDAAIKSDQLVLKGDDNDFDNQFFVVPPNQQQLSVAYLGNEQPDDPEGMLYYFERTLFETPVRKVTIEQWTQDKPFEYDESTRPDIVVVTRAIESSEKSQIDNYLAQGGRALIVLSDESMLESTAKWTKATADSRMSPATNSDYAMLGQIDFMHPIFRPFAAPRLNDFTQIRFWRHMKAEFEDESPKVFAQFDDESPAMWQVPGKDTKSQTLVLATGWQPAISQLALSSKFLPIINRVLELSATATPVADSLLVGQPFELPSAYLNATVQCESKTFQLDPEQPLTDQLARPGVYHLSVVDGPSDVEDISFAVNLDPAESLTEPMPLEQLTAFGVKVGKHLDAAADAERKRKLRDQELENKQRLWKWLILGAIGLILGETWLAGRTDRLNREQQLEATA